MSIPGLDQSIRATLYASAGRELRTYSLDTQNCSLVRQRAITLPADVQYAWPHAAERHLYVVTSNGGPGIRGDRHYGSVLSAEDSTTGALRPHGTPIALRSRPIHITLDKTAAHALISYNDPSYVSVHRISSDGRIGEEMLQPDKLDFGIYTHQTRIAPANDTALVVTRGNDATHSRPEDPGALKLFAYRDGILTATQTFAPAGGYGYGPRHLDFHPRSPHIYVSLERQNRLHVYEFAEATTQLKLVSELNTLAEPDRVRPEQRAGAIHVHPNGRFVYVVNRASGTRKVDGKALFIGGENNIAVYSIAEPSGLCTSIQHIDTRGIVARTFAIDPTGRVLVAANMMKMLVTKNNTVREVPPSIALFRIGLDGKLYYVRKYDAAPGGGAIFWLGIMALV